MHLICGIVIENRNLARITRPKKETSMGPFPHNAPKSVISDENPAGTDGFEFVEFASPEPQELRDLFTKMGYEQVGHHKT